MANESYVEMSLAYNQEPLLIKNDEENKDDSHMLQKPWSIIEKKAYRSENIQKWILPFIITHAYFETS